MKRRDYLKNIGLSSLGLAALNPQVKAMEALEGAPDPKKVAPLKVPNGRTMDEAERDAKLMAEKLVLQRLQVKLHFAWQLRRQTPAATRRTTRTRTARRPVGNIGQNVNRRVV
mgnify:CR=1 FL=1